MKPIRRLKDYDKLICKLAWKFHPSFKRQREIKDMIQDAREVFVILCREEEKNPLPCEFSTALYNKITQFFLNELEKDHRQKRGNGDVKLFSLENDFGAEKENEKERKYLPPALVHNPIGRIDKFFDLSYEMKMLVQILVDTPSELVDIGRKEYDWGGYPNLKPLIVKYFKEIKNWKPGRLQKLKVQLNLVN